MGVVRYAAPTWLDRLPTPAEVEAHAAAHPARGWNINASAWLVLHPEGGFPDVVCLRCRGGRVHGMRPGLDGTERWLPLTAEGLPTPLPVVPAKEGA